MPLLSLSISQLLLAFVSASILHKLTFNRFFLKFLASNRFICYLAPQDKELRNLSNSVPVKKKKSKHITQRSRKKGSEFNRDNNNPSEVFKIPTADLNNLTLKWAVVDAGDLELIPFAEDLEWIVDLAIMSTFSFFITELQFYFFPKTSESNFSLLWVLLIIVYCIKILWKLTAIYFKNEKSIGERSICIISGCTFLLISMIVLITNENYLEFGLESAYVAFNKSATAFVSNHAITIDSQRLPSRPMSFILVKFCLAIICSLIGIIFTFPGLRFGQLQKNLIDMNDGRTSRQLLYKANFITSLIVVCLWIKPISRNLLKNQTIVAIDDELFDIIRIYCVIIMNLLKLSLLSSYVATFLLSTRHRIHSIKCRGGMTTNRELQLTVSSIYNYVNVVAIQYILPVLMCLFTSIMYKTMGQYKWIPPRLLISSSINGTFTGSNVTLADGSDSDSSAFKHEVVDYSGISNSTSLFNMITTVPLDEIRKIFSVDVFQGLWGFATWWLHFSWFCTSSIGVIYHTYFTH